MDFEYFYMVVFKSIICFWKCVFECVFFNKEFNSYYFLDGVFCMGWDSIDRVVDFYFVKELLINDWNCWVNEINSKIFFRFYNIIDGSDVD